MMKFAFDIDDTISEAPEAFAAICNALLDAGHEVHVITYRDPIYDKDQTILELDQYGLRYTELHITGQKDECCDIWGIDIALDDYADFHFPLCRKFWVGFALPKEKNKSPSSGLNFLRAGRARHEADPDMYDQYGQLIKDEEEDDDK